MLCKLVILVFELLRKIRKQILYKFIPQIIMTSLSLNPEQKMLNLYIQNLQKTIESLCGIINTLISDDQIVFDSYQSVKQILGEIKYYEKFNNKSKPISKFIAQTIAAIESHSEHQPVSQILKQDFLPSINQSKEYNMKGLSTIAQKLSEQTLLHNYMRKQTQPKKASENLKTNQMNSKTINQPVSYLKTSREFEIIREQTRRSLDNSGITNKKPLYKELQKFKGTQKIFPAVKEYLEKHTNKKSTANRNLNYTISKFL